VASGFEAAHPRHANIQKNYRRLEFTDSLQCFVTRSARPNDFAMRQLTNEPLEPFASVEFIIDDQDL
jgi:hypothetical protein